MRGVVYQRKRTNELLDEAPDAYKNIKDVMQAQSDLVRTEKTLATILNYKGL
jgi:RNA-splicing ligase RtcB